MTRDFSGLLKIAWMPQPTVGDFMNRWNADLNADPSARRDAFGRINAYGLNVKDRASRVSYVLGGGYIGNEAARYLGKGPAGSLAGAVIGAVAGNLVYNAKANGRGWARDHSVDLGNGTVAHTW